jgi:hypothetical protein
MVKVRNKLKAFCSMTILTEIGNGGAMWTCVTVFTIRMIVIGWHIFKNLIRMTTEARHVAMFTCQTKLRIFIMIELDP